MIEEAKKRCMFEIRRKYGGAKTKIGVRWHQPLIIESLDGSVYVEQAADILAFAEEATAPYSTALQNGTIKRIETAVVHSEGGPRRTVLTPWEFAMVTQREQQKRNRR